MAGHFGLLELPTKWISFRTCSMSDLYVDHWLFEISCMPRNNTLSNLELFASIPFLCSSSSTVESSNQMNLFSLL